ncbi:MAG: GNAT family N-acetyltransferase, partial [Actinobacteria bacterium]|nr:GNAT family N-acetyltransferase [Actinomycetota bacterium]
CSLCVLIGDRSHWGMGHGTDAVMTLLEHAFERYDLARVELWTLEQNERAIRAFSRCGFEVDARLPERSFKDGSFHDRLVMSVTRQRFSVAMEQWRGSSAASQ